MLGLASAMRVNTTSICPNSVFSVRRNRRRAGVLKNRSRTSIEVPCGCAADKVLDMNLENWEAIFETYQKRRKKDTDAIADLAIDNFHEMKDHVGQAVFQNKRKIEMALEKEFPNEYFSKYSLVTFNEDIGYREAMLRGRAQDKAILNMLSDGKISLSDAIESVLHKVKDATDAILEDDRIAGLH